MNSIGQLLRLTSFGESHGKAIGGTLDGVPAGIRIDMDFIQSEVNRRRPAQSGVTTARREADEVIFLSGLYQGKTLGTPIAFIIKNKGQHSEDYDALKDLYRPSHADYTYQAKYGHRDPRGGGRASARETAVRVVAGAIAKQILKGLGVEILAYTEAIGGISLPKDFKTDISLAEVEGSVLRCPCPETSRAMLELVQETRKEGDSLGGTALCRIKGVPAGWGEPIYDKLSARLSYAMLSINAVRAFELGNAFDMVKHKGSEVNDSIYVDNRTIKHRSNHSAGILGGISNGEEIFFRLAIKPTASISKEQQTVNALGEEEILSIKGRHDPIILPRVIPVIEAMTALTLADFYLLHRSRQGF